MEIKSITENVTGASLMIQEVLPAAVSAMSGLKVSME
jgi:hypothetical protein